MGKNIVRLFSTLALLTAACGGETTSGTDDTQGAGGDGGGGQAGTGQAGAGAAGKGIAGTSAAGTSQAGTAGTGSSGVAGTSTAGSAGTGTAGTAGTGGSAGTGTAGTGTAGTGTAGTGTAGSAGTASFEPCQGQPCGTTCDQCPPNANCLPSPGICDAQGQCIDPDSPIACTSCKEDKDCPQVDNGTEGYCVDGKCTYVPLDPCQGKTCGDPCSTCKPGMLCPPVAETCDAQGQCITGSPECSDVVCKSPQDCPVPEGPCLVCPDGSASCPVADCVGGKCQLSTPPCTDKPECKSPQDCPVPKGPCQLCADGSSSCPTATCTDNQCGVEYLPACAPSSCKPAQVKATPGCKSVLGYYWDGLSCQMLNGCECVGECDQLSDSYDSCQKAHASCSPTPGCEAQQAEGVGMCKKLIGYYWDGTSCGTIVGCECVGQGCDSLFSTEQACLQKYNGC